MIEEADKKKEDPKRIGLLLIHGIGDQAQGEHLKNITESLAAAARSNYGPGNVWVTVNPPLKPRGHVSIIIRARRQTGNGHTRDFESIVDIREVWWRDLAENPTAGAVIKFWWWATTFCAARKRIPTDTEDFVAPSSQIVKAGKVPLFLRLGMFFKTSAFFVILLPVHLVFQVAAVFPLFQKIHFLRTVFAYLNSVRLYQEAKYEPARIIENLFLCRRISILRRAVGQAIHFADRHEYDSWFIMGHSLGSVVAHNLLNLSPHAIARMFEDWPASQEDSSPFYSGTLVDPDEDQLNQNTPDHPLWMPTTYGIDPNKFFEKLAGLITYGSPLETFAKFWPDIVMTRRFASYRPEFQWVNLHSPSDLVAARVESLPALGGCEPENIALATHPIFALAHTEYLSRKPGSHGQRIASSLIDWFVGVEDSFAKALTKHAGARPSPWQAKAMTASLMVQGGTIILLGALFLPRLLAAVGKATISILDRIWELVSHSLTQSVFDHNGCDNSMMCKSINALRTVVPGQDTNFLADIIVSMAVVLAIFLLLVAVSILSRLVEPKK